MDASAQLCQNCAEALPMSDDVLCGPCSAPVQLSWGIAHARGRQRGEDVVWDGRRREVQTIALGVDLL